MSYYSEFQLSVGAATKNKLQEFLWWMEQEKQSHTNAVVREWLEIILDNKITEDDLLVEFGTNGKCYDIELAIDVIHDYIENDNELDYAYVRLGEDMADVDERMCRGHVNIMIERSFAGASLDTIPTAQKSQAVAVTMPTQQVKREELCIRCGRMKDVGDACWCCGHKT